MTHMETIKEIFEELQRDGFHVRFDALNNEPRPKRKDLLALWHSELRCKGYAHVMDEQGNIRPGKRLIYTWDHRDKQSTKCAQMFITLLLFSNAFVVHNQELKPGQSIIVEAK